MAGALRAAARWYAQNGWHVFPCVPGQKVPLTPRGFHDATTDIAQIDAWWAAHPNANIGIATEASGLVVVDVDAKNSGDATYEALRAELGAEAFDTLTQITPSGGMHFAYATDGTVVKSGAHVLGQGIDLRAAGGYIVAAPSVVGGKTYTWEVGSSPRDRKPMVWPDVLAAKIVVRATSAPLQESGMIPAGERNATLASIAGSLRRRGLDYDEILGAIDVVNAKRCQPKVELREVERIVQSICRYAPDDIIGAIPEPTPDSVSHVAQVFAQIHDTFDEHGAPIPFGVTLLDARLGGMYPGQMTVLAARTGAGKTSGAEHIIERAARVCKVLVFSLEMGQRRLVERIAARRMGASVRKYREAGRPMDDVKWFDGLDLHIVGKSNAMTVDHIVEHIERVSPRLTVIDHARHICGWLPRDGKMRADLSPAFVMQALSEAAERLSTHIVLLSQVNRNADGTRPSLADLRDSGSVEENADNVIFLHRPFQFGDTEPSVLCDIDPETRLYVVDDVMEWCVWKSRESGTFIAHTGWRGPLMQVYDYAPDAEERFKRCCLRDTSKKSKRGAA